MTEALNHPAGKLAEVPMARLSKYKPEVGKKLPVKVQPYFDAIADSAYGHFARVMLPSAPEDSSRPCRLEPGARERPHRD